MLSTQKQLFGVSVQDARIASLLAREKDWYLAFQHVKDGWPERTFEPPVFEPDRNDPDKWTVRIEVRKAGGWPPEDGLWDALVRARTQEQVRQACERWERWLHPSFGLHSYPQQLAERARDFLKIKRDKRFPKSLRPSSDAKKLEQLARGMAGTDVGISPITAIDRVRKIKHGPHCPCWPCEKKRYEKLDEFLKHYPEPELKHFAQGVAVTTEALLRPLESVTPPILSEKPARPAKRARRNRRRRRK
jgi:hypothetical protein